MTERGLRVAGAALIAIVAAWAGTRVYLGRSAVPSQSVATPVGEASAPIASDLIEAPDPSAAKIPEHLPKFSLQGLDGKSNSIDRWRGRSLIINFWATWCAPCRREIPLLEALSGQWADRDVTVVGIAVDHREQVSVFAKELKIGYPVLIGEQDALDVAASFGVESPVFPFTVFTDRRGEVVALFIGELHEAQANLILSVLQNLNQDRVALAEARRSITEGLHSLQSSKPG
jgi:thiol-disulfide isomerase/thioredoxin